MQQVNDDKTRNVLARNLQKILKDREWSVRQLARKSGDPVMTINNIVAGRNLPKAGVLVRVADALQVPLDSLFTSEK
jgi:transcriptional regulator with XRE-family HTH domain